MPYPEAELDAGAQVHRAKLDFHGKKLICVLEKDMISYVEDAPKLVNGVSADPSGLVHKSIETCSSGSRSCEVEHFRNDGSELDTGEGQGDGPAEEDFEFVPEMSSDQSLSSTKGLMLSADKLFCNGKLLPLYYKYEGLPASMCQGCDLCLSGQGTSLALKSSSSDPCRSSTLASVASPASPTLTSLPTTLSAMSSPVTSPVSSLPMASSTFASLMASLTLSLPPLTESRTLKQPPFYTAPAYSFDTSMKSALPKSNCKYSTKIKVLFKSKFSASIGSRTCKLPIYPGSLWPFSRSNSAGESKTGTYESMPLPHRSNSSGDRIGGDAGSLQKDVLDRSEAIQSYTASSNAQPDVSIVTSGANWSRGSCQSGFIERPYYYETPVYVHNMAQTVTRDDAKPTVTYSGGHVAVRRRAVSLPGTISRCSPARRGSNNSPGVKVNAGKILLRNLERCTAERKLRQDAVKGSRRQSSFYSGATTIRVTPVLNGAVCKQKSTNGRAFGFEELFAKVECKPEEPRTLTNWGSAV